MNNQEPNYGSLIASIKEAFIQKSCDELVVLGNVLTVLKKRSNEAKESICRTFNEKDVVQVLCSGLCTSKVPVITGIFQIYEELIDFGLLPDWKKLDMSLTNVMRVTSVFLLTEDYQVVSHSLVVLKRLIVRIRYKLLTDKLLNVPQIINLLLQVQTKNKICTRSVVNVIISLMEGNLIGDNPIFNNFVGKIFEDVLHEPTVCDAYCLASFIKHQLKTTDLPQNIWNAIGQIVVEVLFPYLNGLILGQYIIVKDEIIIIEVIKSVYESQKDDQKFDFAFKIYNQRILNILQRFERHAELRVHCELIRNFVVKILSKLCDKLLEPPIGFEWFDTLMISFRFRPMGYSYSKIILLEHHESDTLPVVYSYFSLILDSNIQVEKNFESSVCKYLMKQTVFPRGIVKAVWFLYAFAYFNRKDLPLAYFEKSNEKLINIIMRSDMKFIFTRHLLVFRWSFLAVKGHIRFKHAVLDMFLEQNDSLNQEIALSIQSDQSLHLMCLEYLKSCTDELKAMTLSNILFPPKCSKSIAMNVWNFLPELLSSDDFQVGPKMMNLNMILNVCLEHFPDEPLRIRNYKVASGMLQLIMKYHNSAESINGEDYITSFKFFSFLISIHVECIQVFLCDIVFLYHIELCLMSENETLLTCVLNFIVPILMYQLDENNELSPGAISVDIKRVEMMLNGSKTIIRLTLELLELYYRKIQMGKCVLSIDSRNFEDIISLYTILHDICLKDEAFTRLSWNSLREILLYSKSINRESSLVGLLHTSDLIKQSSPSSKFWASEIKFLKVWIKLLPPCSNDSLKPTAAEKTVVRLANSIIQSECETKTDTTAILAETFEDSSLVQKVLSFLQRFS